jgi:hypothetical protein
MDEQLELLRIVTLRLESAGIPYMLTGSMAMAVYAVPRMTRDIDLVVDCLTLDARDIYDLFEPDFYIDIEQVKEAITTQTMFNVIHTKLLAKADLIVRKHELYRETEFGRRHQLEVDEATIWVVSPEDLVISKLLWAKESGSELQQRDARAIILSVGTLDRAYMEKWASELSVSDLLKEVSG